MDRLFFPLQRPKPNWHLMKQAAIELTKQGISPFTRAQLIEEVLRIDADRDPRNLHSIISYITVNTRTKGWTGIKRKILYKVDRAKYELYEPQKHGA